MKTICIASKTGSLLPLIMAVIFALLTLGCEEAQYVIHTRAIHNDSHKSKIPGPQQNEIIIVDPAGTRIVALDGTVELYFLEGAVLSPTEFSISSFHIAELDMEARNLQKWGILLESTSMQGTFFSKEGTFHKKVRIWLKYDRDQFQAGALQVEDNLTIYSIDPNIYSGTRIESIGNCSGEPYFQKVKGYISRCGYYVVGEK